MRYQHNFVLAVIPQGLSTHTLAHFKCCDGQPINSVKLLPELLFNTFLLVVLVTKKFRIKVKKYVCGFFIVSTFKHQYKLHLKLAKCMRRKIISVAGKLLFHRKIIVMC